MSELPVYKCPYCGSSTTITIAGSIWLYGRCTRHGWFPIKMLHVTYFKMMREKKNGQVHSL